MESKGQVNKYVPYRSNSDRGWYTINLANGVTPFIKSFDGIECNSLCYRLDPPAIRANVKHAWYRPGPVDFDRLEKSVQDHILNGGLLCAPLAEAVAAQLFGDPVLCEWEYETFQAWCLDTYGRRLGPLLEIR